MNDKDLPEDSMQTSIAAYVHIRFFCKHQSCLLSPSFDSPKEFSEDYFYERNAHTNSI
jgi:hypothetical protein